MTVGLSKSINAVPMYIVGPDGETVNLSSLLTASAGNTGSDSDALDTNGNPVPLYKAHTFTYDTSGNQVTDSVTDGGSTWTKTTTYTNGQQTSVSGWVKQ